MIAVTHTGKAGDFGQCLPICSWLYKTYNEKIIFIFPKGFPFIKQLESLIRLQSFTEDIIYCDFSVANYDIGGQPYKFNPHDYVENLNVSRYYNFGFRTSPDKYVPEFYAEEYGLGVDEDFILNLDLQFKYNSNKLMCTEVMHKFLPHFEPTDLNKDFLRALQDFAYAKERHMHFSSLSIYLSLAKIPFYLYTVIRDQPFVDLLTFEKTNLMNPDDFWIYHRDSPVLDIRSVDENNNLVSIYDKIFFK
jgi:hypothetical protein